MLLLTPPPPPPAADTGWHAGIAFLTGKRVTAVNLANKTLALDSGESVSWQQLVVATGAEVRGC
jgi:NADPH-dependent 2,4-dienoyl-CoA reductase/sulfur reductase-like enzyme